MYSLGVARVYARLCESVEISVKEDSAVFGADVPDAEEFQLVGADALKSENAWCRKSELHNFLLKEKGAETPPP